MRRMSIKVKELLEEKKRRKKFKFEKPSESKPSSSSSSSSSKHTDWYDADGRPCWATHDGASYHDLGHCCVWDEKEGRAIQIY